MTLDDIIKFVQILFYLTAATIAVLTYLSAKKGLLNTVNTEYHKRVLDKLQTLSDELYSEFDPDSPNYWANENEVRDILAEIHKEFNDRKDEIINKRVFEPGILVSKKELRLQKLINKTKSDPFVPPTIREFIIEHLEKRAETIGQIHMTEFLGYANKLVKGKASLDFEDSVDAIHNRIVDKLYEANCGVSQVELQVHELRLFIQKYLDSFNPIKKNYR